MKAFYQDFTLAVVGGGQLGRMLLQACADLDLKTRVLDPDPQAPCSTLTAFHQGSLLDFDTVYRFGKQADLVTIEIENVNVDALRRLEEEGIPVYPQPRVIDIIQDKRRQKQWYRDKGIPTADFLLVEDRAAIARHLDFLPAFHKLGRGGYDGGGVQRLDGPGDLPKAFDAPGLLEKAIDFDREISVIAARSVSGEVAVFPPVECVFRQDRNLVDYLLAPSSLAPAIQQRALDVARQVVEGLQIVGLLAVEMFVTKDGEVLVNECAPRPHNSGHQTIEANAVSQYEQLLRAILDLPLGNTAITCPSAMVNLLGEPGHSGPVRYEGLAEVLRIQGVHLTLYGKKVTKPFRKMGHITILDRDLSALRAKVEEVRHTIRVIA